MVEKAPAPVVAAMDSGELSVNLASKVAALPAPALAVVAAAPAAEIKAVAKEAVAQEAAAKSHRAIGSGENEWYTPAEYIALAREVLGSIDLDPASCDVANEVVQAGVYFTKDDDGLSQPWSGNVWCNPPYSRDLMPAFCEKLTRHVLDGDVTSAILLSHNNTDTGWFHNLASVATAICFVKTRIKFYSTRTTELASPTNGQAFFYFGDEPEKFIQIFKRVGFVASDVTPMAI